MLKLFSLLAYATKLSELLGTKIDRFTALKGTCNI